METSIELFILDEKKTKTQEPNTDQFDKCKSVECGGRDS